MTRSFCASLALLLACGCAASAPGPRPPAAPTGGSGGSSTPPPTGGSVADAAPPVISGPADAATAIDVSIADAAAVVTADGGPGTRSAGCGSNNPGGMFMIPAGAGQQPYLVVLPRSYDGKRAYPLVFYLHGRGNDLMDRPRNLETAVAAADLGIVIYAKSITGGWEVPGRDMPVENTAMLRAIKQKAFEQYCVDPGKVVMTGFSSGGNFIGYLQCTMAGEIAAAVLAGGSTHAQCMGKLPALVIVGRGDPSFAAAETSAEYLRNRNGCAMARTPGTVAPCEYYDGCPAGAATGFCPFAGGHMWPGFAASAVAELLGKL
jgi:poly(3-hydroxybutyrate) depolymerase